MLKKMEHGVNMLRTKPLQIHRVSVGASPENMGKNREQGVQKMTKRRTDSQRLEMDLATTQTPTGRLAVRIPCASHYVL